MPSRTTARRRSERAALVMLVPFLAMFALFMLAPIGYALYLSVTGYERTGPLGLGEVSTVFVGFDNYARALGDADFIASIGRVALFGVVQVPLMLALATTLALLLDSASARWAGLFRTAYFLPYGVPGVIASILWGFLYIPGISPIVDVLGSVGIDFDPLGGSGVLWAIANILIWEFAGYNMLVVVAQLHAVSHELYEAARVDGATGWQLVRHIKLPLIRPALVLTAVFSIIGTLQLFSEPLVLRPLSTSISSSFTPNMTAYTTAFSDNLTGLASAMSVIIAVVAVVLSFTFLRIVNRNGDR